MKIMEAMKELAMDVNDKMIDMMEAGATMELAQDLLSTRLYNAVYNIVEKDLDLKEYYNWGLDSTLDDSTRGEFTGYSIKINRLNAPAAHLIRALYEDDKENERYEYNMALTVLSTMAHEMRHAWQRENNVYDLNDYISSDENYDDYYNQDSEVDARNYQNKFFTRELYNALVEAINKR